MRTALAGTRGAQAGRPGRAAAAPDDVRALRAAIPEEAAQACLARYGDRLRALVLTGSLARDEATFVREPGGWCLLGDADFLLVLHEGQALPPDGDLRRAADEIEAALASGGVRCHVGLAAVGPVYLRRLPPSIFAYELRACGRVVRGDGAVLRLVRAISMADIPLEDAWRLLANRIVEQLETLADGPGAGVTSDAGGYRTVKLYLDMATSLLLFAGGYAPTYAERLDNLRRLADGPTPRDAWPFLLGEFAEAVAACTCSKLNGNLPAAPTRRSLWERAVEHAERLWRWELARLTGLGSDASNRQLLEVWMRRQSRRQRLRGWLSVLRREGWQRSWREWPRWAELALGGSPRYWVYFVAGPLFFSLPALLESAGREAPSSHWGAIRRFLPVPEPLPSGGDTAWRELAAAVAWNYSHFLVGTRA